MSFKVRQPLLNSGLASYYLQTLVKFPNLLTDLFPSQFDEDKLELTRRLCVEVKEGDWGVFSTVPE